MGEVKFHVHKETVRPQLFVFLWYVWGLRGQAFKRNAFLSVMLHRWA